jgi:cytochrome c oxidase subunit 4
VTTISPHDPVPTEVLDGAVKAYSRDKVYVFTALFLGFITVIEVLTYEIPEFPAWSKENNLLVPVLLILMAVKFFTVAWVFMHLKFDKPILTWVFYSGLLLALAVYLVMLTMFRIWWGDSSAIKPRV